MYEFAVVVVDAPVVVSGSLGFRRRRLVTYHSKHALKPTATIAVRDTDNPTTAARDNSFSTSTATVPVLLEQTLVQRFVSSLCFCVMKEAATVATVGLLLGCVPVANI